MIIQWYGHACFRLQGNQNDVAIVVDPYDPSLGKKLPKLQCDILIMTTDSPAHQYEEGIKKNDDNSFTIKNPGEYEVQGVSVKGIPIEDKNGKTITSIYAIRIDDIIIAHLGALNRPLTEKELDSLGRVDILLLPVGGATVLDAESAVEVLKEVESRVVIPMQYAVSGLKENFAELDVFLKEYGLKALEPMDKYKIAKKDLPVEETTIIALQAA